MDVIPSLDLLSGNVVRLRHGDFKNVTAYGDPETVLDMVTPLVRWVADGVAPGTLTLAITQKSSGEPLNALHVSPFNPLAAAPQNNGLNSNYRYVGLGQYEPGHELWCSQQGLRLECSRTPRSASK